MVLIKCKKKKAQPKKNRVGNCYFSNTPDCVRPLTGTAQPAVPGGYIGNVTVPWVVFADGLSSEDHFPLLWEDMGGGYKYYGHEQR